MNKWRIGSTCTSPLKKRHLVMLNHHLFITEIIIQIIIFENVDIIIVPLIL